MSKLTITIAARNDNHANYVIDRLYASVCKNIQLLSMYLDPQIEFEYLIVDWGSSPSRYLHENEKIKKLLHHSIKFIIAPQEIIKNKFGYSDRFYQFFAKNIGIRYAAGEWCLLFNADNILNKALVEKINSIFKENNSVDKFYRTKYWVDLDNKNFDPINVLHCEDGAPDEEGLAPIYAGDFLLCKKNVLIEKGKGHDESNVLHQTELPQAHMDGEILFNLKKNGVVPVILNNFISHITHPRAQAYDYVYNKAGYENTENWGFSEMKEKKINSRVSILCDSAEN